MMLEDCKPRKGVILAGGTGSRLGPLTRAVNKHLLPVHDKPLIYYPIATLMKAGIREIAIVSSPDETARFQRLLGDGSKWGMQISHLQQPSPMGIPDGLRLARNFLSGAPVALALGDNVFASHELDRQLRDISRLGTPHVLACRVPNPGAYGVLVLDEEGKPARIVEKPRYPVSSLAVTGLYFLDEDAADFALELRPSTRGELEIADLLMMYIAAGKLGFSTMSEETAWHDAGTPEGLHKASICVRGSLDPAPFALGSPDVAAWQNGWISTDALARTGADLTPSEYGRCLVNLARGGADALYRADREMSVAPLGLPGAFRHAASARPP